MAQMDIYEAKIDLSGYASWGGDHHYPLVEVKGEKVHIDIDDIEFVITTETATYLLQNLADKLDYRAIELTTSEKSEKIEKAELLKEVERVEKERVKQVVKELFNKGYLS